MGALKHRSSVRPASCDLCPVAQRKIRASASEAEGRVFDPPRDSQSEDRGRMKEGG